MFRGYNPFSWWRCGGAAFCRMSLLSLRWRRQLRRRRWLLRARSLSFEWCPRRSSQSAHCCRRWPHAVVRRALAPHNWWWRKLRKQPQRLSKRRTGKRSSARHYAHRASGPSFEMRRRRRHHSPNAEHVVYRRMKKKTINIFIYIKWSSILDSGPLPLDYGSLILDYFYWIMDLRYFFTDL